MGTPPIEAAAIAASAYYTLPRRSLGSANKPSPTSAKYNVVAIFHEYAADTQEESTFVQKHIHGLNQKYIKLYGMRSSDSMIFKMQQWLDAWPDAVVLTNDPVREEILLGRPVTDIKLPQWADRVKLRSHQLARGMKLRNQHIYGTLCPITSAHADYKGWPYNRTNTDIVKKDYGPHCALYSAAELYFFYSNF